jgi:subtilisin family serine protease
MLRFWLVFWAPVLAAQVVPGKYIVELTGEPAAAMAARVSGARLDAALQIRPLVRAEQARLRPQIEAIGGRVAGSADIVANALIVEIPDAGAPRLAQLPGVLRVSPVPLMHASLDRALPLLQVPDAWTILGGISNAGAGIKIGIIDSGITTTHPGFQDSSLTVPPQTVPPQFPLVNQLSDLVYTNNKIIVARNYVQGSTAQDRLGHGTAVAMCAAGVTNTGPLATITGIAPKAWLGSYKVNDSLDFDGSLIFLALDDAVADGMDVINISSGAALSSKVESDPTVAAVERASSMGVVMVLAAGNNGPSANTVESPASAPSAIAVGAVENDRVFAPATIAIGSTPTYYAQPDNGPKPPAPITAPVVDVATLDTTGEACVSLPPNSLKGNIALILRSPRTPDPCTFELKLKNAQSAGAVAAIVYMNQDSPDLITMDVGAATLPSVSVDNPSGMAVGQRARSSPGFPFTIQFTTAALSREPNLVSSFSSRGPNVDLRIKPDLVATGDELYTATQKVNPFSLLYDASGYLLNAPGTSFASPLVAGAVAVLKGARPGLTPAQYRSLVVNSATPLAAGDGPAASLQWTGAGLMNAGAAVRSTLAVSPVSLSFGASAGTVDVTSTLTLTNVGTAADTFTLSLTPITGLVPTLASNSLEVPAGSSQSLQVHFSASPPAAGQSQGYLHIRSGQTGMDTVVPYWFAVPDQVPFDIPVLSNPGVAQAGSIQRIGFRIIDRSGVPVTTVVPTLKVITGSGSTFTVSFDGVNYLGVVRLGSDTPGNVYQIDAGPASVQFSITGQ